ncbi:hypothetical protein Q8A64_00345 [Oxalobacteraceae bacterium R-40]|uniref:Uncharacterized protein n=1 Tax=Keguizhuia sedimenti TaxID=3064264 RepID=A0ABU1BIL2_9BURK|nr:hypothetical protein [Oxalobacteraceae bacterium R-40]
MKMKQLLACLIIASLSIAAHAFERPFPQIAKRGTLSMTDYPSIEIDGKERRLAVGAWIKNQNNTIDMPVTLRGREFIVNYTENMQGEIDRVWILRPEEAKRPAPNKQQTQPQNNQPMMQIH